MLSEKDPAIDREEFESRLNRMINPLSQTELSKCVHAMITNDTESLDRFKADMSAKQAKLDKYLSDWDAAPNEATKRTVVGSVKIK